MEQEAMQTVQDPNFIQTLSVFMNEGGAFMWIILIIWCIGITISLERFNALIRYDINANKLMKAIKKHVIENNVMEAIKVCSHRNSVLSHVLKSGLKRANQTREQVQDAIESTVLEVTPKVEKRLGYLALLANISTLMGLLGTIYGLIQSFAAVASADPAQKAELLALGISKAMNTTAFGLISAITIMILHQILSNKADKIMSDVDEHSTKLIDLLTTKKHIPNEQSDAIRTSEEARPKEQKSDDNPIPSIPKTA